MLAQKLNLSEKIIRNETEVLKTAGLISPGLTGMELTEAGIIVLESLRDIYMHLKGLFDIEERVKEILGCEELILVDGDSDESEEAMANIGKAASKKLLAHIEDNVIIALTGGNTLRSVVNGLKPVDLSHMNVMIVPARGSLGTTVMNQANTIVSDLAEKINAQYRLLNIPDNLSQKALESVRQEPEIQETISFILHANIIIYGIGNAKEMAIRRKLDDQTREVLAERGAVAEVLGHYFDAEGNMVYASRSIGISTEDMTDLNYPIAVVGGRSKGEAIWAVKEFIKKGCLIIDEGAAKRIIELCS